MVQIVQIQLSKIAILQGLKYKLMYILLITGHFKDMFYDSKTQFIQFTDSQSG